MAATAISPPTSPYLAALRAAAVFQQRPTKSEVSGGDDPCFVCGRPTKAGQAYCSDECRTQDEQSLPELLEQPSPLLSPAPNAAAVPPLVPSRRSRSSHKTKAANAPGNLSSPPSSATGDPDEDMEEDIEKLILPPAVGSYNKKNALNYGYAYGLATSPAVARSPIKSPKVKPSATAHASSRSPSMSVPASASMQSRLSQQGLQQHLHHHHQSSNSSSGLTSPSMPATEVITFRRRYQPDSVDASKPAPPLSPALIARRKSANLNGGGDSPKSGPARLRSPKLAPAASSSSSSSSGTKSDAVTSTSSSSGSKLRIKAKSNLSSFMNANGSATAHPLSSFVPLQRRVSEPHSPYASPRLTDPASNPFDSSFTPIADTTTARRVSTSSYNFRRPSLSSSATAPAAVGPTSSSTRPQDYAGFAGFLAALHNRDPLLTPDSSESGYEGHDERDKRRGSEQSNKEAQGEDKYSSRVALHSFNSSKAIKPNTLKDKLANLISSSASSSSDSGSVSSAARRPTRFMFGRGAAAGSSAVSGTRAAGPAASSNRRSNFAAEEAASSEDDLLNDKRTLLQSAKGSTATLRQPSSAALVGLSSTTATSSTAARSKQTRSTSDGDGYVVKVVPTKSQQLQQLQHPNHSTAGLPGMARRSTGDSALVTSSSSSSEEDEADDRVEDLRSSRNRAPATKNGGNASPEPEERGRSRRKSSSQDEPSRVTPLATYERAAQNSEGADRVEDLGRGRSKQRASAASLRRSVSPNRSSSRASSRDPRRLIPVPVAVRA